MSFKGFNPWDIATHNEKQLIVVLSAELANLTRAVDAISEENKNFRKEIEELKRSKE